MCRWKGLYIKELCEMDDEGFSNVRNKIYDGVSELTNSGITEK